MIQYCRRFGWPNMTKLLNIAKCFNSQMHGKGNKKTRPFRHFAYTKIYVIYFIGLGKHIHPTGNIKKEGEKTILLLHVRKAFCCFHHHRSRHRNFALLSFFAFRKESERERENLLAIFHVNVFAPCRP